MAAMASAMSATQVRERGRSLARLVRSSGERVFGELTRSIAIYAFISFFFLMKRVAKRWRFDGKIFPDTANRLRRKRGARLVERLDAWAPAVLFFSWHNETFLVFARA